jgi:MFS family permease
LFAERFGRLRVILAGLVIFTAGLVCGTVVPTAAGTVVAFCLLAAGASAFIVNAMVVLWNLAPSMQVHGAYTGLFTVAFVGGGFLGPALIGGMVDLAGWRSMLIDTALIALVAVLAAARVGVLQRRSPGSHVL